MSAQRRFILNADDVGMHPDIDTAVLHLAESGIVSSASVMVLARPDADVLRTLQGRIDLGLHLDLTSTAAIARHGGSGRIGALLARAHAGFLHKQLLRHIIDEQLQRFCELNGRLPVFIDGHEHVHQFPVARDALKEAIAGWPAHERPYIRDTRARRWRGLKAAAIGALGASALARQTAELGCGSNTDFFGVYPLQREVRLDRLWQQWLAAMPAQGALAMCHPAMTVFAPGNAFRLREYRFLFSVAFAELRHQYNMRIVGWREALGDGT